MHINRGNGSGMNATKYSQRVVSFNHTFSHKLLVKRNDQGQDHHGDRGPGTGQRDGSSEIRRHIFTSGRSCGPHRRSSYLTRGSAFGEAIRLYFSLLSLDSAVKTRFNPFKRLNSTTQTP